jgi:transposase
MANRNELESTKLIVEGKEEAAFSIKDSAQYLGISYTALQNLLSKHEDEGRPIKRYSKGFGRQRYLLKKDLDDLQRGRVVE